MGSYPLPLCLLTVFLLGWWFEMNPFMSCFCIFHKALVDMWVRDGAIEIAVGSSCCGGARRVLSFSVADYDVPADFVRGVWLVSEGGSSGVGLLPGWVRDVGGADLLGLLERVWDSGALSW